MTGARVELTDGSKVINLVSQNFLGLATHPAVEARGLTPHQHSCGRPASVPPAGIPSAVPRAARPPPPQDACRKAIEKYGVGSCGPRGFYGTIGAPPLANPHPLPARYLVSSPRETSAAAAPARPADVHIQLEEALARHMGTDEAIMFSYDMLTIASSLPAFSKRGDLLVVDEGVNFAVQNGVALSRSEARAPSFSARSRLAPPPLTAASRPPRENGPRKTRCLSLPQVRWFKHNDVADLERVLQEVKREDASLRKPLNRRFIVVEGLYSNYGAEIRGDMPGSADIPSRPFCPPLAAFPGRALASAPEALRAAAPPPRCRRRRAAQGDRCAEEQVLLPPRRASARRLPAVYA